jgi:hypothetical protein
MLPTFSHKHFLILPKLADSIVNNFKKFNGVSFERFRLTISKLTAFSSASTI